jgi:hypothetical protein
MSALRTLRVDTPDWLSPSRILRGVALHCRRMPVVLLNSRIVGDSEVGQGEAIRSYSWMTECSQTDTHTAESS